MTNYECGRALVYIAEVIIKTFGEDFGLEIQTPKQKPAEPLIKDKKTRKAVRAWADANSILGDDRVEATTPTVDCAILTLTFGVINIDIFIDEATTLKNHGRYTIAELCGEEEE